MLAMQKVRDVLTESEIMLDYTQWEYLILQDWLLVLQSYVGHLLRAKTTQMMVL